MTTLTLDLPQPLSEALAARSIDEEHARRIALSALELTVEQGISVPPASVPGDAADFARNVIARNRALFEELAQR